MTKRTAKKILRNRHVLSYTMFQKNKAVSVIEKSYPDAFVRSEGGEGTSRWGRWDWHPTRIK